jgi:hypothetical protein
LVLVKRVPLVTITALAGCAAQGGKLRLGYPAGSALAKARLPRKAGVMLGVPVAAQVNWRAGTRGCIDPRVEHRHHLISLHNGQRAAWAEIILHVNDQEGIPWLKSKVELAHFNPPLRIVVAFPVDIPAAPEK